tara:strand:- start:2985 stop:3209 length:225 start_codon:yes stop_codon:yes gene_type:complete
MSIIVLSVICGIAGYVSWETIKYNKRKKENERNNKERCCSSNEKKSKPKRYKKISKVKAQNKRKPRSPKKKIEQ